MCKIRVSYSTSNINAMTKSGTDNCVLKVSKDNGAKELPSKPKNKKYVNRSRSSTRNEMLHGEQKSYDKKKSTSVNANGELDILKNNTKKTVPSVTEVTTNFKNLKWAEIFKNENKDVSNKIKTNDKKFREVCSKRQMADTTTKYPHFGARNYAGPHKFTLYDNNAHIGVKPTKVSNLPESLPLSGCNKTSNESVHKHILRISDKSIQCNLNNAANLSSKDLSKSNGIHVDGSFAIFDPVRSLHFLVQELCGMLNKNNQSENIRRIMLNIENTLQRITSENATLQGESNGGKDFLEMIGPGSLIPGPLQSMSPPVKLRSTHCHEGVLEPGKDSHSLEMSRLNEDARKNREDLLYQLQVTDRLRKDIDQLREELNIKEKNLNDALSRERELSCCKSSMQSELDSLKKKFESQTESLAKLAPICIQLSDENKVIPSLQESLSKAHCHIDTLLKEKEELNIQLEMFEIEREKYQALIRQKDMNLDRLNNDIKHIQNKLVQHRLDLIQNSCYNNAIRQVDSVIQLVSSLSDVNILESKKSVTDVKSQSSKKPRKVDKSRSVYASSPIPSVGTSPNVSSSWDVSRISSRSGSVCSSNDKLTVSEVVVLDNDQNASNMSSVKTLNNFQASDFLSLPSVTVIPLEVKCSEPHQSLVAEGRGCGNGVLGQESNLNNTLKCDSLTGMLDILNFRQSDEHLLLDKSKESHANDIGIDLLKKDLIELVSEIENDAKRGLSSLENCGKDSDKVEVILSISGMSQISTDGSEDDDKS